ncbi:MAG TPA: hypothetical protein VNM92_13555 [Thermoanaerobaculia bacterium]|nr:hypothetical protein [Thermoanaerobaculia bacterium]
MKSAGLRFLVLSALALTLAGCSGGSDTPTDPGRGSLRVVVTPSPILAQKVPGTSRTYDFPFELALTEMGGRSVTLSSIILELKALGIPVFTRKYDVAYLRERNYSPLIPASSTVRYSFNPRDEAIDAVFSSTVEADIRAEGMDDLGNAVRQTTTVSVRRN